MPKRIGVILITADRGLCGSLNADIWRALGRQRQSWREQGAQIARLSIIGAKGIALARHGGLAAQETYAHYGSRLDPLRALSVVRPLVIELGAGTLDALFIAHARSLSALRHEAIVTPLLPLSLLMPATKPSAQPEILAEPDLATLRDPLLRHTIAAALRHAIAQTRAAEQCARALAMQQAERQASSLSETLLGGLQRARQAAITNAIAEAQAALD